MTETLFVCVPGVPVGKQSVRVSNAGPFVRKYMPKKTRDYETLCGLEGRLSMAGRPLMSGPIELNVQIFMRIPTSWPLWKREAARLGKIVPTTKPDSSNVLKAIEDGFTGNVWNDDCQVVDHHMSKRYSDTPCVMVQVTALDLMGINDKPQTEANPQAEIEV